MKILAYDAWSFSLPGNHTFASIQARNDCSRAAQAWLACPEDAQHPNTDDMMPKHGFSDIWFGRLILSLSRGGSRGALMRLLAPLPGGLGTIVNCQDMGTPILFLARSE